LAKILGSVQRFSAEIVIFCVEFVSMLLELRFCKVIGNMIPTSDDFESEVVIYCAPVSLFGGGKLPNFLIFIQWMYLEPLKS